MFFKKYLNIIILVLLVSLFIGAVSANDSEINDLNSDSSDSVLIEDNLNEKTILESSLLSDDVIVDESRNNVNPSSRSGSGTVIYVDVNAEDGGDGSSTNPYKNLTLALDNSVDGSSIFIAPGIYKDLGNVNLTITQNNLVILGNGQGVIFDGENTSRIFNITGSNVTIQGITFKNANTTDNGGAIYASKV